MREKASFPYWWNKIRSLDIPQPKTVYVPMDEKELRDAMVDITSLQDAADDIGGYPIFLRTDQTSVKHGWQNTCYVRSAADMKQHALHILEADIMADMAGYMTPSGFAVREFLELDHMFCAFSGRIPISTEVRVFLRDGSIECVHPYWPAEAIMQWVERQSLDIDATTSQIPENWRDILGRQNAKIARDAITIQEMALKVAGIMDGWWSCDMALGRNGIWYMIDMAPGPVSYHWPSCRHASS